MLVAATDTVAVEVSVLATVVVIGLVAATVYLLVCVRRLRREAEALAGQTEELLYELSSVLRQAEADVERVDRMVGSAEAISGAVGSASRLVGGAVASPLIKAVAFGSGLVKGAKLVRQGVPLPEVVPPARPRRGAAKIARSRKTRALAPSPSPSLGRRGQAGRRAG